MNEAVSDGLTEASSLHPVIDPAVCIGCSSCVTACPEQNVLGLIHRKAELINPSNCIGHGACKTACPENAIKLVYGSLTRGMEIPDVSPTYQTCVPGIFIAGELGGMGLIRNAIEQGRQAFDSIAKYIKQSSAEHTNLFDCVIVGAGPAGLTASLAAKKYGLKTITFDQDSLGGTIAHFPRGKLVMTQSATIPLVGKVKFGEIKKESLMKFWLKTIEEQQINIQQNETLLSVTKENSAIYRITTTKSEYLTKSLLLAIGRRGTPRKLNVPGEEMDKVVYKLIDPNQYRGQLVLVVGGGDSAIEAACDIAELNNAQSENAKVYLSYRKGSFGRAKVKNRNRIDDLEKTGDLQIFFSSQVKAIEKEHVILLLNEREIKLRNQAVIICAGGILPTKLLKDIGIKIEMKYGDE